MAMYTATAIRNTMIVLPRGPHAIAPCTVGCARQRAAELGTTKRVPIPRWSAPKSSRSDANGAPVFAVVARSAGSGSGAVPAAAKGRGPTSSAFTGQQRALPRALCRWCETTTTTGSTSMSQLACFEWLPSPGRRFSLWCSRVATVRRLTLFEQGSIIGLWRGERGREGDVANCE